MSPFHFPLDQPWSWRAEGPPLPKRGQQRDFPSLPLAAPWDGEEGKLPQPGEQGRIAGKEGIACSIPTGIKQL